MSGSQQSLVNLLHRECLRNLPDDLRPALIATLTPTPTPTTTPTLTLTLTLTLTQALVATPSPREELLVAIADALDPGALAYGYMDAKSSDRARRRLQASGCDDVAVDEDLDMHYSAHDEQSWLNLV